MIVFLLLAWKTFEAGMGELYAALAVCVGANAMHHYAYPDQRANEQA